jgi:flagellar FliL protein
MASGDDERPDDEASDGGDGAETPRQGLVKKILGNRRLLIASAAALILLVGGSGAGLYVFVFSAPKAEAGARTADAVPVTPPQVAFYDVPAIITNLQSTDGNPVYLKLSTSLELDNAEEKPGLAAVMPRIVDQFQGYLRELRIDDLKGSAGVIRLKEELLRRINVAAAPYHVRDVLLKEMIVQ